MITFYSLGSSSFGNCYFYIGERNVVVIDPGVKGPILKNFLTSKIDIIKDKTIYVLITHCHNDHINSIGLLKEFLPQAKICAPYGTLGPYETNFLDIPIDMGMLISDNEEIIAIPFNTLHDAPNSVGYKFILENKSFFHLTDCGRLPLSIDYEEKYDVVLIECNLSYEEKIEKMNDPSTSTRQRKRMTSNLSHLTTVDVKDFISRLKHYPTLMLLAHSSSTTSTDYSDIFGYLPLNVIQLKRIGRTVVKIGDKNASR